MEKIKIIALFGKSASGKDTYLKLIKKMYPKETNLIISHTTRPKRDYEKDQKDYYFISKEEFANKIINGDMLEATCFNNWFYGTSLQALDNNKINIGIFNPSGINCLFSDTRIEVYPIEIFAEDKIRLLRSLKREKNPNCEEICRRFFTDAKDFEKENYDFSTYFTIINNKKKINKNGLKKIIDDIIKN